MHGYQAGEIFSEVLKRSGGKTDEASIVDALESLKAYDTGPHTTFISFRRPAVRSGLRPG
jgi:hypothetical protein